MSGQFHRSSRKETRKIKRMQGKRQNQSRLMAMVMLGAGLVLIGVVGALLLPKTAQSANNQVSAVPMEVNYPAPNLALTDLQGNPTSLADYRGQVVMVNNWATWCPPCKAEMPALNAYYQAHKSEGFTLVGIDAEEAQADVTSFINSHKYTYPIWLDPQGKAQDAFHTNTLPSSYVIDGKGVVRLAWSGPISEQMLEKYLTPLIKGQ